MNPSRSVRPSSLGVSRQRGKMIELFREMGGHPAKTVAAYADAERRGEVQRRSNKNGMPPERYAARLFADGKVRGWLQ